MAAIIDAEGLGTALREGGYELVELRLDGGGSLELNLECSPHFREEVFVAIQSQENRLHDGLDQRLDDGAEILQPWAGAASALRRH